MSTAWSTGAIPDQTGRVVIITGASSGLGFEAARVLVAKGAHVVLACRNPMKAVEAERRLRAEKDHAAVEVMALDVSRMASVRAFAERFRARHKRLDALCNNAGVMALPHELTDEGLEVQMATNHFGPFALTGLLIDLLAASGPSRVVNVSSALHRVGGDRFEALMAGPHNPWIVYGQSKLANLLFTAELDRRLRAKGLDVRAVACHPGYADTGLQTAAANGGATPGYSETVARVINRLFAQPAAVGAWPTLYALTAPDARGGDFIGPGWTAGKPGPPRKEQPSRAARDPGLARRLWSMSVRTTRVDFAGL